MSSAGRGGPGADHDCTCMLSASLATDPSSSNYMMCGQIRGVRRKKFRGFPVVYKLQNRGSVGCSPPDAVEFIHSQTAFFGVS